MRVDDVWNLPRTVLLFLDYPKLEFVSVQDCYFSNNKPMYYNLFGFKREKKISAVSCVSVWQRGVSVQILTASVGYMKKNTLFFNKKKK